MIPAFIVDAVVHEPWGAHPSYAQGYYDRDNEFYVEWEEISRTRENLLSYLDEYVYGVRDRGDYLAKLPGIAERLDADRRVSAGVNYGY
jgi:glutaconate CoA-transferase subunit A